MGRQRMEEWQRRKRLVLYVTELEEQKIIDYFRSLRGVTVAESVSDPMPSTPSKGQEPVSWDAVGVKPVRGKFESPAAFQKRVAEWKEGSNR